MSNLKYKLEALLFSSARTMKIDELANLTKASVEEVREKLNELKKDYGGRDSSITLIDEGDAFKLNVKSEHASTVHQIVTETELSKTLMETLAIIAFKYPIKQSDLIKIRTNKAYDHLRELEDMGYIIRQKYGRTKLIKLTPKFFEYFDLPAEKLKDKFENFEGIAQAIKEKEDEVKEKG
jgi:segregation and condensation protein B